MKNLSGFTLIEIVIYLSLFTLIIGGGTVAVYQIIQNKEGIQRHLTLREEANFLIGKINWALKGATLRSISPSELVISKKVSGANTELTFRLINNDLTLQINQNPTYILNSSWIEVSEVSFVKETILNSSAALITVNFSLATKQTIPAIKQNFSFTRFLYQ